MAGMLPLDKLTESDVLLTVPPHCETFGTLARVIPAGKASLNATPFNATEFGLLIVKVSAEEEASATGFGENTLLIAGGSSDGCTTSVSQVRSLVASWSLFRSFLNIQFS